MATPFQHILCPVDFTDKNAAALQVTRDMASWNEARVTLLHVIERVQYADDEEIQSFYSSLEEKAMGHLEQMAQQFADQRSDVQQCVVYGRRGPEIVRYTVEHGVDLVVMSSHQVDLSDLAGEWATLSYQVSILCPCPVLLVK